MITKIEQFKKTLVKENLENEQEEQLYHEINWVDIEKILNKWYKSQSIKKLSYDTMIKTFGKIKDEIEKYKMLN